MLDEPLRGRGDRAPGRDRVAITEIGADTTDVEDAVGGQRLGEQRASRERELERHRDDLQRAAECRRDQLNDLADRQHLLVPDIEQLARGRVGLLDRQQERMGEVLGVAVVVQREPIVGDDYPVAPVEDPTDDQPFARRELMRTVHVRVAKMRRARMVLEHRGLGSGDAVSLLVVARSLDDRRVLADRYWQPGRVVHPRIHPSPYGGYASYRDELADAAGGELRDTTQPAVHRGHDVEGRVVEGCRIEERPKGVVVIRVGMDVRDGRWCLRALVRPAVHDGDVVAAFHEAAHERDAGRPGAADDQHASHGGDAT